jgi:hypothetical protein
MTELPRGVLFRLLFKMMGPIRAIAVLSKAGGLVLVALSLEALLVPAVLSASLDPVKTQAAAIAFPGLFPPVAVSVPLILATSFAGWEATIGVPALGLQFIRDAATMMAAAPAS